MAHPLTLEFATSIWADGYAPEATSAVEVAKGPLGAQRKAGASEGGRGRREAAP